MQNMFDIVRKVIPPKNDFKYPLCGHACDKPKELYNPYKDTILGDLVIVYPLDTNIVISTLYGWVGHSWCAIR